MTLTLIVLLMFTMFFTEFDWRWVVFLAGILFASVLSLVSTSVKSGWRIERRTAQLIRFRERLNVEIEQHRRTREQFERELSLHQQDRVRLANEAETNGLLAAKTHVAETLLGSLAHGLDEIAVVVDRDQNCRFHTVRFAAWAGIASERIDGRAINEVLPPIAAEALRPYLLDALDGRAGRTDLSLVQRDGTEQTYLADFRPQREAVKGVSGALLLIKGAGSSAAEATDWGDHAANSESENSRANFMVTDESGNAVYLKSLTEELRGWSNPRERIREAIDSDGFVLYCQEIVALRKDAVAGSMQELLIRMRDEEQNLVPPGTFLPIAERCGMMPAIDRYVVRKAIARAATSHSSNADSPGVLCINLARATLEDKSFPEFVARALERSGVSGKALCFEIDYGDAVSCSKDASRLGYELKPLGCRFTLDGFGRGGVSFEHVRSLPLNFLKIDGSIVLQLLTVPEAMSRVRAIQRVCGVIGLRTIAEMVENDDSLARLRAAGVDYAQGFGIAQPRRFDTTSAAKH